MSRTNEAEKESGIPVLEGWISLTEAGEKLGITRQHSWKLARDNGYRTLHRIGTSSIKVVSTEEVDAMVKARTEREHQKEEKAAS